MADLALGIDVGGTKLAVGLVDPQGSVVASDRVPTRDELGPEGLWLALRRLIDHVVTEAGNPQLVGIGVGCGGPMTWPDGAVSPLAITSWRDFPLRERLAETYGEPVRLINDAIALAVAEHWVGAAQGCEDFLGIVVSTGVGGGLVLGGRVLAGATGNAGHLGHVVVEPDGSPCHCGAQGCVEAIASGPALTRWAMEQGWTPPGDLPSDAESLTAAAHAGDITALAALARAGSAIGVGLASAAALCDLELVVVGGGVSNAGALLLEPMRHAFRRHAGMGFVRRVAIEESGAGPEAGVVGAAALVHRPERYWPAPPTD